jgi:hypothetical protein
MILFQMVFHLLIGSVCMPDIVRQCLFAVVSGTAELRFKMLRQEAKSRIRYGCRKNAVI